MKTSKTMKSQNRRLPGILRRNLLLPALCLAAGSATAATEQWLGVPGTSATTNWTDSANWTASVQQTYYNEVQFTGTGAEANTAFSINNVLDATTGVAQMPIWQLDFIPLNGNYTTLIDPGVTLTTGAGNGTLTVGADILNNSSPAAANAFETITLTGAGGAFNVGGNIYIGQGSTTPGDTHNVTLDLSGLDNFTDTGGSITVAGGGLERANGSFYLAKTNNITLPNSFQICNQNMSNSLPCVVELGIVNNIAIGSGNNLVVGGGGAVAGAVMKFNPAFIGGATVPSVYFYGTGDNGRIPTVYIGNGNGGAQVASTGVCDFSGGNPYMVVDSMQLGQAGSGNATGTLTFDNNYVDANNIIAGNQTAGGGGAGVGILNVNTNATLGTSGTLLVRQTLTLAAISGTLTPGTAGTVNINGGTMSANTIVNGGGTGTINVNSGSLAITGTAGTAAAPVSNLNVTNSVLGLAMASGSTNVFVSNLKTGGTTNIINITAAPSYTSYPTQVVLIKYTSVGGAGDNFGLGSVPPLYAGHLVNNTANGSIDVLFTSGATTLTWSGNVSDIWDTTTANWLAGSPTTYADGQAVQFLDGASSSTVDLSATFQPSSLIVSNNSLNYTFNGSGALAGSTGLTKSGAGTLTIDNSGNNTFSGNVTINSGTLQVGNSDANGGLPAVNIVNNGTLTFARSDSPTVNNAISGTGSVVQSGGALTLSGANTYAGNVLITNTSSLKVGSSSGLGNNSGSVIVANGSTLDINNNNISKPIIASGTGVDGNGAIYNSSGGYPYISSITLTGDTTFNLANRFDLINATLNTGGNAYNLTLNDSSYSQWQGATVDPALANIILTGGTLGLVGQNSFGNPAGTLTLSANSTLMFYGTSYVNKGVDLQAGLIQTGGGNNVMNGPMTLESGFNSFNIGGGTSLTLSNVLSGTGTLDMSGGNGSLLLAGNSPSYTGNILVNGGTVTLNGSIGGTITDRANTTLAGSGSAAGLVDVSGTFYPGSSGVAGTFTAGALTLESSAAPTFDLSSSTTSGNDLVQVNGSLSLNGNNININPLNGTLADGTYTLINYTGSFSGSIGTATTTYPTAYTLVLTNNTTTDQIQLIVSGTLNPSQLIWNNASGSGQWDVSSSANWSNVTTHASASVFNTLDSVVLDDSILNAATPATNINIATTVIPSAITNNSSVSYTLSGSGSIGGSGTLTKQGSGTLTISTSGGNFTGAVNIYGGLVYAGNNCFSAASSIMVTNNSTMDIGGGSFANNKPLTISGSGVNGEGAIFNSYGDYPSESVSVTLAGDATFGGSQRWDLASGSSITGAHNLTIDGSASGGLANNAYMQFNSVTIGTNVAGLTLTNGQIGSVGNDTSFQNPATVLTLTTNAQLIFYGGGWNGSLHLLGGGTVTLSQAPAAINGSTITLETGAQWYAYGGSGNEAINSAMILNGIAHFLVGDYNRIYTNVFSGSGGFVMDNYNHAMVLSAVNTYTGPTIIANGPEVALTGTGSISQSSLIFFGGSSPASPHLDVSGRSDQTLTLASGQTLAGVGAINGSLVVSSGATLSPSGTNTSIGITTGANSSGAITATNSITLNGTTIIKLNGSGVNDQVQAGGSINYGGTLNLVNISGSALANGNSFQVFQSGTGSYNGSFASVVPATPGAGLAWDLSQLSSGIIGVKAGATGPVIGSTTVSGGKLVLSGSGGTANATYYELSTTNLLTPLASWVPVLTNTFSAAGTFSVTNALVPGVPQEFYLIKQP